jgi:uncharacterized phage-like protein YoqJ
MAFYLPQRWWLQTKPYQIKFHNISLCYKIEEKIKIMSLCRLTKNWDYPKEKALCFTGHRPEKIPYYHLKNGQIPENIEIFLKENILCAIENGIDAFYCGLARGVDLWAGKIILDLKKEFPHISLIGVQPYPEHGKNFTGYFGKLFKIIYDESDMILCTCDFYHKGTYLIRDRYMVDHSCRLIGICDMSDEKSGTYYTINYAKSENLLCTVLDVSDKK